MAKKKNSHYLAVQKNGENSTGDFAFGTEKYVNDVLEGWKADPPVAPPEAEEETATPEPDFTHESALTDALSRAVDFGLSQYELIRVASLTPSLFEGLIARERVLRPAMSAAELVSEDDRTFLFRLTEDQFLGLVSRRNDLELLKAGVAALPKAALMSIVATFDTIVVDIVSKMLRLGKSEWLKKCERSLPVSRLQSASNVDELVQGDSRGDVPVLPRQPRRAGEIYGTYVGV